MTELNNRIRQAQRNAQYFLSHQKFTELASILRNIDQLMRQFYKPSPEHFKSITLLRLLNQQRKREQLTLAFNNALLEYKQKKVEESVEVLLAAIEEIVGAIQAEKIRIGYMDEKEGLRKNQEIFKSMAFWQIELARFYYLLAFADKQSASKQVSYSALLKSLQIIKELYQSCLKSNSISKEQSQSLRQLIVLCESNQEMMHSKGLSIIQPKLLRNLIDSLFFTEDAPTQSQDQSTFHLAFDQLAELNLKMPLDSEFSKLPDQQIDLNLVKILHFLCLCLLIELQDSGLEQQLNQESNSLVKILISVFLSKRYINHTKHSYETFQRLEKRYKPKKEDCEEADFGAILTMLSKKNEELKETNHLDANTSFQIGNKPEQYAQSKTKILEKAESVTSAKSKQKIKQKKKEKGGISKGKSLQKIEENTNKDHREKVQAEYKLKGRVASKNGYLVQAIHRNRVSTKKEKSKPQKQLSPPLAKPLSQRQIRSESALELNRLPKQQSKRQKTANPRNRWKL